MGFLSLSISLSYIVQETKSNVQLAKAFMYYGEIPF